MPEYTEEHIDNCESADCICWHDGIHPEDVE